MCNFLKALFKKKTTTHKVEEIDYMKKFLIVGLGNIGEKYANTRHNIGFKILDFLAEKEDLLFETQKLGDITTYKFKGRTFILLKPSTYMNLSGKAILYWLTKEKIPLENLLVITDDLNLPFGSIRIKTKGSDGGHNGLKDTQDKLNTTKYNRFRFGISDAFSKGKQVDYVLGEWTDEENAKLRERLEKGYEIIKSFGTAGINNTMNAFNGK
ncbi:aminoacyl-tRNA hydrolase [Oceanihabitans sp. 2_MG-2023]|uniref:aminoacyl-tRNA hydrolase n=1 Tax=Oceanihabitans sp. 2_MG-2023 TaxID=3062661 RepID=UPI0026E21ECA|nr:aminoacyl-tRNA hydrolase [Oceanihabitans sp. 2_MG-2023]MDO6596500.1 aminoacyl-tRNA hydrolase [Oceanihabitans sp. 2_MG-2023]